MKAKWLVGIFSAVVLSQLSGCAAGLVPLATLAVATQTPRPVGVTAYARRGAMPGKRFVLEGPDPHYPGGDPAWPGYARQLTSALEAKGYTPVDSSPDLIIRVSYNDWVTTDRSARTSSSTQTTNFHIVLHVEALDAKSYAAGKPTVVWSTHADVWTVADDIGPVFPSMVAAMQEYFDTSEPQKVTLWVAKNGDDGKVKVFRASDFGGATDSDMQAP